MWGIWYTHFMRGFYQVEEDWMDFLDYCIAHPFSYVAQFRKTVDVITGMGYSDCLYYFIAMGIDAGTWAPHEFTTQLGIDEATIQNIYDTYAMTIEYDEPTEAYLTSSNSYYEVEQDLWNGELQNAWKVRKVQKWLSPEPELP